MKPRPNVFKIAGWVHDPKRRKHRFRCQACQAIVQDGADVVIERRGKSSHGYHAACFENSLAGEAAMLREKERMNP